MILRLPLGVEDLDGQLHALVNCDAVDRIGRSLAIRLHVVARQGIAGSGKAEADVHCFSYCRTGSKVIPRQSFPVTVPSSAIAVENYRARIITGCHNDFLKESSYFRADLFPFIVNIAIIATPIIILVARFFTRYRHRKIIGQFHTVKVSDAAVSALNFAVICTKIA